MAGRATVGEFAAAVRQEYPGQFDGVSDDELVHAVVQEKPELGEQVDLRTFKPTNVVRPKQGPLEEARSLGVSGRALGTAVGAGKSLIRTPYNIIKGVANVAGGQPADAPLNPDFEGALENKNVAESFGGLMTDAALAAGGEGLANAGVKAVLGATKVPRLLGAAGRIVKGAIVGGSVAKAEGGSGTAGAVIGAAGPAIGEAADVAVPFLKSAAKKSMSRVLGATTRPMKATSTKVVPTLIKEGVTGSREAIASEATQAANGVARQLQDAWDAIPADAKKVPSTAVTDRIDGAIAKLKYKGPAKPTPITMETSRGPLTVGTEDVAAEGFKSPILKRQARTMEQLKQIVVDHADAEGNVDAADLRDLKATWDKVVSESKGYQGAELKAADQSGAIAHRTAAHSIRRELDERFPDIAKLNSKYTFWKRVKDVMGETLLRTSSQSQPIGQQLLGAAGLSGGYAASRSENRTLKRIGEGLMVGGAAVLFRKVTTSGKWGSVSAVTKDRLANAIASGNAATVGDLVHKIAFSTGVQLTREEQQQEKQP